MDDRELLERAAKAAGIPIYEWRHNERTDAWHGARADSEEETVYWRPLTDDGDALRLAVKLCMQIECCRGYQHVSVYGRDFTISERHDGIAPYAATRRAIVRAAAALASNSLLSDKGGVSHG